MNSAVAVCRNIDDAPGCAAHLGDSILSQLDLKRHSVGILLCDADMDALTVTAALKSRFGFEIIGMTVLAALTYGGRRDSAAVLTVLTADDCLFATSMSASLRDENYERTIGETCGHTLNMAREILPEAVRPELAMAFCPLKMNFPGDVYPQVIGESIGDVPLIGGIAADDYDNERARVFFSGRESRDGFVLLYIFGNIRPVFALCHVTSRFMERTGRVTKAEKNIVYKIDEESFIEYLEGFGFNIHTEDTSLAFLANPLRLVDNTDGRAPVMRYISGFDTDSGAGVFGGVVPEGVAADVCLLKKDCVEASCRKSLLFLLEQMEENIPYSTVFCISCRGRAMLLGLDGNVEGRLIADLLPDNLTVAGGYSAGEIFPVQHGTREGKTWAINRFHNCTVAFCLL